MQLFVFTETYFFMQSLIMVGTDLCAGVNEYKSGMHSESEKFLGTWSSGPKMQVVKLLNFQQFSGERGLVPESALLIVL